MMSLALRPRNWPYTIIINSLARFLPRATQVRPSSLVTVVWLVSSTLGCRKGLVPMSRLPWLLGESLNISKLAILMPISGVRPSERPLILYNVIPSFRLFELRDLKYHLLVIESHNESIDKIYHTKKNNQLLDSNIPNNKVFYHCCCDESYTPTIFITKTRLRLQSSQSSSLNPILLLLLLLMLMLL